MFVVNITQKNLDKLNYKNLEDWLKNENHVYIGNTIPDIKGAVGSKWKNPFDIKEHGVDKCIELFTTYLHETNLIKDIEELRGKSLGCWCSPEICHGDVLEEVLENILQKEENTHSSYNTRDSYNSHKFNNSNNTRDSNNSRYSNNSNNSRYSRNKDQSHNQPQSRYISNTPKKSSFVLLDSDFPSL
jgi:hypothetical protein